MPKCIQVNHWHQHFTYVTKKTQSPTIKITFNYTPFILYTPGSLTEVANKPEPNRYVRERKGSSSPTAKRGVPQLSCQTRGQRPGTMCGTGQGHSSSAFPFGSREGRQQSRKGRKSTAPLHGSVSQERLPLLPPSTIPVLPAVRMDRMQLLLLTADQELVLTGHCMR